MKKVEQLYISLCVASSVLSIIGNLTYQKMVSISVGSVSVLELSVGAMLYPLTFLISNLITEFYGRERSIFSIHLNIGMNISTVLIIIAMDALPATQWSRVDDTLFHQMFGFYSIAFASSLLAYYAAQRIDILLFLSIRTFTKGRWIWLRNTLSTAISLGIDTTIVIGVLAMVNALPESYASALIIDSYLFKLSFVLCSTPLFYFCTNKIKKTLFEPNALGSLT